MYWDKRVETHNIKVFKEQTYPSDKHIFETLRNVSHSLQRAELIYNFLFEKLIVFLQTWLVLMPNLLIIKSLESLKLIKYTYT